MYENNKKGLYGYAYNNSLLHYLCGNLEHLRDVENTSFYESGNKSKGTAAVGGSGYISGAGAYAGTILDERATLTPGSALVLQSFSANNLGGGAKTLATTPVGITIANSSFQIKATPNFLYIGSTTSGYLFTPTGGSATSGIP